MLAGLLRAPSRYAPTSDLERAQGRASVILRLMQEQGFLTEPQVIDALTNPARLSEAAAARAGGFFADWVMDTAPAWAADQTTEDVTIETTFDPAIQQAAEDGLAHVFATKVKDNSAAQAAIIVMSADGAVRAMVGGRERGVGQFNRAVQAKRQTGSAFKPIVYAAALEAGMRPGDIVVDEPLRIRNWTPENYDNRYRGPISLTQALTHSINTVAVRVSERAGQGRVRALAAAMGITTPLAPGPAIALGTSEATLIDMTGVYATIANRGRAARVTGIREILLRGDTTPLIAHGTTPGEQVMGAHSAELLTYMLSRVVAEGTGRRAQLSQWPAAGKTGTTQAARDAWFIGFTADYVVGVWMGNDDNAPLTGVTGGGLPAEIWREVMERIQAGLPARPLPLAEPEPSQIVLGPSEAEGTGSVVEQVFLDVLQGLGANGDVTPDAAPSDWQPVAGTER